MWNIIRVEKGYMKNKRTTTDFVALNNFTPVFAPVQFVRVDSSLQIVESQQSGEKIEWQTRFWTRLWM